MKIIKRILSIMLAVVMLSLAACGTGSQSPTPSASGSAEQASGGMGLTSKPDDGAVGSSNASRDSLVIGSQQFPATMDYVKTSDLHETIRQLYDGLVIEYEGEILPAIAERWDVAEDATSITFYLRDDAVFHDGSPITADDVVFSINRAAQSPFVTIMAGAIDKAEKIDEKTVLVTFQYPYGPGLNCFTTTALYIAPKAAIEADEEAFGLNPIGSGPYMLTEWVPGEKIVMTAFPDYYKGEAAIKTIQWKLVPDPSTLVIALEKGEIDMIGTNTPEEARQALIDNPNIQYAECESNAFLAVMFNNTTGPFADKRVREAVSYAVDRDEIIDGAKSGMASPVEAALLMSCPEYPENFQANPLDIEKGKALLAEAGYPDGFTVTMKTIDSPTYTKPTEVLQAQLKKIGIDVQIEILERGKYMDDVTINGDFDITFWAVVAKVIDADFCQYSFFHSSNLDGRGNYMGIDNAELDALLDEGRACIDLNRRKEIYARTCEIIKEESMCVPLFCAVRTRAANIDLVGLELRPDNAKRYYFASWK